MSRSYRKPFYKDKTDHSWYNRLFRRTNKQLVKMNKEPKLMREIVNDWDVCDWKIDAFKQSKWWSISDIKRAMRK